MSPHLLVESVVRDKVPHIIPSLEGNLYKGDMGRIGVVGGCREYTGAPYVGAMSALRVGGDLSHVFCAKDAALAIKSYSPELIVHPYLPETEDLLETDSRSMKTAQAAEDVSNWFSRLDCLVIGPGLGQDQVNLDCAHLIMKSARDKNLPMVVDADALRLLAKDMLLLKSCTSSVITPNFNELHRLATAHNIPHDRQKFSSTPARIETVLSLAKKLDGPVVVSKGPVDVITDGNVVVECSEKSTPRRCGGQGDVLAGCMSVMLAWAQNCPGWSIQTLPKNVVACYGACCITRITACLSFQSRGRSMVCTDMIPQLVNGLSKLECWGKA